MKISTFFIPLIISLMLAKAALAKAPEDSGDNLLEQRERYQQAVLAYNNNDLTRYQELSGQLKGYPLHSYLTSLALKDSLHRLPYYEIDQFLEINQNTVIGQEILEEWLTVLAEKKHWHDFRSYYDPAIRSTELQCYSLWSRIKTADKTAFTEVESLWNVKQSQPEACDPLFSEWIKQGYLSEDVLWQRYQKAVKAKEYGLTRYLKSLATADKKPYFDLFNAVYKQPQKIQGSRLLNQSNRYSNDIIVQGLRQLQRVSPEKALESFRRFESQNRLNGDFKSQFLARNNRAEIRKMPLEEIQKATKLPSIGSIKKETRERLLLRAVREQNWSFYLNWYNKLDTELKKQEQWLYWYAHALNKTSARDQKKSRSVYQQLAQQRSYYGFLAADKLKQPYNMVNTPLKIDPQRLHKLNQNPAIARARELFFVDDIRAARREWRDGSNDFTLADVQAGAKLTSDWGWHRKAIELLGSIKAWDHLSIRFPVMYQDYINKKAARFNYSPSLIFAVARQESAWQQDATSHAGARGLMQLIPSTAKDAAKKVGVKHQKEQLYLPKHNILLGSFHISELLEKYNNNRLPAIAAYNAGQHRVNQWMKQSKGQLPYDLWIEMIPFSETRKYVKNVLYYSALYDYRSGNEITLLTPLEKNALL